MMKTVWMTVSDFTEGDEDEDDELDFDRVIEIKKRQTEYGKRSFSRSDRNLS